MSKYNVLGPAFVIGTDRYSVFTG